MFSSDEARIRIAELKAKGDRGDIQRLRQSAKDAAAVMEQTAAVVEQDIMSLAQRTRLVKQLRRGAGLLRGLVFLSAPKGKK